MESLFEVHPKKRAKMTGGGVDRGEWGGRDTDWTGFPIVPYQRVGVGGSIWLIWGLNLQHLHPKAQFPHDLDTLTSIKVIPPDKRHFYLTFTFYNCIVPMWFFPWEIWVAFPTENQLLQSCAAQPIVHAGCFSVSIIHRTPTWTTGSLTCAQM